ncbi:DNA (cytosine-5-)-methyltransferase [Isoptericola sp. NPDC055881]
MSDQFTFIDLFAGIGGFHAALAGLGGRCVYVAEKDSFAQDVYKKAWLTGEHQDVHVTDDINEDVPVDAAHTISELVRRAEAGEIVLKNIPENFDVLAAGFPCQAFSKSGRQLGVLDSMRGTLFYNILMIVAARRPKVVFLENVKNLIGPEHRETTFKTIVDSLKGLKYVVNDEPTVFSPHSIAPWQGGGPQSRERVYILAVREDVAVDRTPFDGPKKSSGWSTDQWKIGETQLRDGAPAAITAGWMREAAASGDDARMSRATQVEKYLGNIAEFRLGKDDVWYDVYKQLLANVVTQRNKDARGSWFPGHPIWFQVEDKVWLALQRADANAHRGLERKARDWKDEFLDKSQDFIKTYSPQLKGEGSGDVLAKILKLKNNAWRKLEWQALDAESLTECLIQLRPSGVRVKKATYTPALVAINQAPILGSEKRRLTPYEAGRLQLFPDEVFQAMLDLDQRQTQSYKQFGNAVHVGTVQFALTHFMLHHFGTKGDTLDLANLGGLGALLRGCRAHAAGWVRVPVEGADSEAAEPVDDVAQQLATGSVPAGAARAEDHPLTHAG